jgi:sulfite reductase (NADPH) hemoprotein beta-component
VIDAVLSEYKNLRVAKDTSQKDGPHETFIDTLRRVGMEPFKAAANSARFVDTHAA